MILIISKSFMSWCKKYIKALNDVKQEQNPLKNILFMYLFNFFAITKPKKNDPIIEIMKLLSIYNLKIIPKKDANEISK